MLLLLAESLVVYGHYGMFQFGIFAHFHFLPFSISFHHNIKLSKGDTDQPSFILSVEGLFPHSFRVVVAGVVLEFGTAGSPRIPMHIASLPEKDGGKGDFGTFVAFYIDILI
jgi:hypothetical protein